MRLKKEIPEDELRRLRKLGWSRARLARKFGVSESTVKRRLNNQTDHKEKNIMTFAMRLKSLGASAPPGYCRTELARLVSDIMEKVPDEKKKAAIIKTIASGAWTVVEIAGECRLTRADTERLLNDLEAEGRVGKRVRGGVQNRGRKMKLDYFLI